MSVDGFLGRTLGSITSEEIKEARLGKRSDVVTRVSVDPTGPRGWNGPLELAQAGAKPSHMPSGPGQAALLQPVFWERLSCETSASSTLNSCGETYV